MKLSTTAAVITGGASGLGEATARYFASQGAQVTILDRDAERGEAVAKELKGYFAKTDVTDEESVQAAIDLAMEKMGKITATVNCAGIAFGIKTSGKDGPHPLDKFKQTLDVNLVGTFNVSRLASGEGSILSDSRRSRMNASIGVFIQSESVTCGTSGRSIGRNDQCCWSASAGATHRPNKSQLNKSVLGIMGESLTTSVTCPLADCTASKALPRLPKTVAKT